MSRTLHRSAVLVLALSATSVLTSSRPAHAAGTLSAVRCERDVAYFDGPGADASHHKLDLYLPKTEKGFPIVLFVHGGAWQRGSKDYLGVYKLLGNCLAEHGIGVAVINYRLSPAVQHPEHIRDVARAFAWLHKNAASYGGRADRLFVCGHSAGGHLVSLLATDPTWLKAEGLTVKAIRGVISLSGVYDLFELPPALVARTFGNNEDVMAAASPARRARAGLPPFLILYADHDLPGCDQKPAEAFARALNDKGTKAEIHQIADCNHYLMILGATNAEDSIFRAILSFITAHDDKS